MTINNLVVIIIICSVGGISVMYIPSQWHYLYGFMTALILQIVIKLTE